MVESQPHINPAPGVSPSRGNFVGRQQELAELKAALEDALSGHGRLVMLAGEPGIGKTRTAQELANHAQVRGARVLWGRCHEERGAPPYWPWLQAIGIYVQEQDPERLRQEMGEGAPDIGELFAEVRSKLPDLAKPATLEPEQARFRLFDSICTFLKNAARSQPLMLVLDDLHWADQPSLLFLQFLAREMGEGSLLVVGTYRDVELSRQHPLSETLAQLTREPVFQRHLLRGLTQIETHQFIASASNIQPSQSLVDTVYSQTEGNPFFMGEVIRLLSDQGDLEAEDFGSRQGVRIPEGVREVIGQRLNRLSESCNQMLTVASIVGREFEFRLLVNLMTGVSEEDLLSGIEEAAGAHLIEEISATGERYQFSHALVQETLAEEVAAARRVRLHARIGEAMEELYAAEIEAHAGELAHHFAEAEPVFGTDKLVRYSLMAGERALATYAYEDALTHYERGLIARHISLSGAEAATDEEAANLLFGLARAQSGTVELHQIGEAFAALNRAFKYYAEAGNVAQAVAAAEFIIGVPTGRIPESGQLIARALTLVPADSHESGRLLSRYGGFLGLAEGDYEGAQQALGRAMAIARREGDMTLEVQTLAYAADVSGQHLHWQESIDNGLRAIELAADDEHPYSEVLSRYWTVVSLLHMGALDVALPHALALRDVAERRNVNRQLVYLSLVPIVTLSCLKGDWRTGREYSDRGLEVSALNPQLLALRVLLEHETGESAQGEVYLERLLKTVMRLYRRSGISAGRPSMAIATIARITGFPDRLEIAESAAEAILSDQPLRPISALYAKTGLALLAVQRGDQSAAEKHYAYFLGHRGTMIWTVSSVDRLLGLLSQTMGNLDQAEPHFEDALAFCRKAGYRPELAWTCCDYADTLLERNGRDDHTRAVALLDESLTIASELGMRPLMERVVALHERSESQPAKAPTYPDGLTQREVEVLRLIAVGKTDREIADELVISSRTVNNHVRSILNKTAVANRTEAATYAALHGLVQT